MLTIIFASTGIAVVLAAAVIIFVRLRSYRNKSSAELSRVRSVYDEECKKVESCKLHIQELTEKIADYERRITEGETASEEMSALLEKTKEELRLEEEVLKEKTSALQEIKGQLTEAEIAFENEKEKVRAGNHKITNLNKELAECRQKLKDEQALVKEKITELEKCNTSLFQAEKKLEAQDEKSSFIADVVNAEPETNTALEEYKSLLNKDYQDYANDNDSLAEEARAMKQLLDVQDQLELIAHDEELRGKTIIAVGGAFSSGKSSFMNSFFVQSKIKLPTGMDQTTAVASYVMSGTETEINGYSYSGGKLPILTQMFSLFSYGKEKEFKFNMKKIIDRIIFKAEFVQPFEHVCFIDTPGFNPGSNAEFDYDTATTAIANAQVLLWCFDVNNGTIRNDELQILQDIAAKNPDIKIYIVANRADLKSIEENEEILVQTELLLESNFVEYAGIDLYTSREKFNAQPAEYPEHTRKMPLTEFLEQYNQPNLQKEEALLSQVRNVFEAYIQADKARIKRIDRQIKTFNAMESSFAQISGQKDEIIAYYKARKSKKLNADNAPQEDDDAVDALIDNMAEIKMDLHKTLQKDKADILAAEALCKKFCTCIMRIFGGSAYDDKESCSLSDDNYEDFTLDGQTGFRICKSCGGGQLIQPSTNT
ncbi:MAG: dynamin family protein [Treponema sp.]